MIRILILLLFPLAVFSQRYTVLDTAYTVNDGGQFFQIRNVLYSTGETEDTKTLIGDTSAYFNRQYVFFQDEAARMARTAQAVFGFGKRLTDLKKENTKILLATGKDILDTITVRNAALFTDARWIVRDTSPVNITFSINANGQLRYEITGQATRNADLFGEALILNNYLNTGKDLFLFMSESQNYRNREGTIILRRPGGAQNRATDLEAVKKPAKKKTKKAGQ